MEVLKGKLAQIQLKSKLVASNAHTHISMAVKLTGLKGDVFQIGVFLFRASLTIEKVLECTNGEGAIIVGRLLDSNLKPCFAVLNRDDRGMQCIVGPNRIYYDATDGDEYKIFVPSDYLRKTRHALLSCPQPLIEVYTTPSSNREFKLAGAMNIYEVQCDLDQSNDPQ